MKFRTPVLASLFAIFSCLFTMLANPLLQASAVLVRAQDNAQSRQLQQIEPVKTWPSKAKNRRIAGRGVA